MTKKIQCEIQGTVAMLQHKFNTEDHGENTSKGKKKVYVPQEEAEKACYRSKDGKLHQPSEHILGALIKAGVQFKYEGKKTYKEIIKAGIIIEPDLIPLLDSDGEVREDWDEIDARAVVISRARIVRWRPKFNDWKLRFEIEITNPDEIAISTLKEILEYAGKVGIGDYRPRFGRFMVTEFKEIE